MVWRDKYKIGIELVDRQHEELFARVSGFLEALKKDESWDAKLPEIKRTMKFMQNYVVVHFTAEEKYQAKIGYPQREQHHKIHEDFKTYVNNCAQDFENNGYTMESVQKFAGKLLAWLVNHVVSTDLKMAEYINPLEARQNEQH